MSNSPRLSNKERKEKVLKLFSMYPRTFSIKEITDFYKSLDIHINRNSLRKTLDDLVKEKKIKVTKAISDKKGRRFYLATVSDIYAKLSTIIGNEELLFEMGYALTPECRILQEEKEGLDLVGILEKNIKKLKLHYPFHKISHEQDGSLLVASTFSLFKIDQNTAGIKVSPCLCRGEDKYQNACSMVAGSLTKFTSFVLDPSVKVNWIRKQQSPVSFCEFRINVKQDIAKQLGFVKVDLDDPAERERVIPGL